jgi:branched-chain amino acid transport system substrate-binding protein
MKIDETDGLTSLFLSQNQLIFILFTFTFLRNRMKTKFTLLYVTICLFLSIPSGLFAEEYGVQRINIGIVVPLSGDQSLVGEALRNSFILANEKINSGKNFNLIFEDDEWKPLKTVTAVNKLISFDQIKYLFVFGTNQSSAVVNLVEKAKIPFFSLNINPAISKGTSQTFIVYPNIHALTKLNIEESIRRGYKTVVTTSTLQDSCLLQQNIFDSSGEFSILKSIELPYEDTQMKDIAIRIKHLNPDAVFLSTIPPQGANLARRLREIGYEGDFFGGIQEFRHESLANSKGALLGSWFVSGDDASAESFYQEYKKRFGVDARDYSRFSVYAFDSLMMLDQALQSGDMVSYLRGLKNFTGASGSFSYDGNNGFTFPVTVQVLK